MMNFTPRRQQGNAVIGVIVGMVIGLIVAVGVALVITKGTSPFTDKLGKAGKSSEPTASQISDPNQPMYGARGTVQMPAKETSPAPPPQDPLQELLSSMQPAPTAEPAAAPAAALAAAPAARSVIKQQDKPRSVEAVTRLDAQDDKYFYFLQVGAFRNMSEAENSRARLALLGLEAAVTDRITDNGVLHRVRVGPFSEQGSMNRVRTRLTDNGIDVAVVRNQKPTRE
ncbi:MAG: cell division protein FtsN [Janthinobacterium sp.]|jgi:cell division protein FtsN